ncbi:flagellar hook protein FlgE [Variovorax sp. HJSM1_2]|uniref:flagellar hook protein FlgE n=1 Tax=Variovorax sp. HJSM1_2 TaxID=3366263 RepID=UPI003BDD6FED
MSFQQGLSGLNAASKGLDVIGHNIANANTTGMKASRAEFAELYASSLTQAAGGGAGIGVVVNAISQQFTQGNITVTGNDLDVAINGSGFFQLQLTDGSMAYGRAGNFKLDESGNIITNDGAKLIGNVTDPITGAVQTGVPLTLPTGKGVAGTVTDNISLELNLDTRTAIAASTTPPTAVTTYGTSLDVYDTQGASIPVGVYFSKTAANTWDVYADYSKGGGTTSDMTTPIGSVTFDADGKYVSSTPTDPLSLTGVQVASSATAAFDIPLDLSRLTQDAKSFAVTDITQTGSAPGQLTGISIADNGDITARFSNGVTQIAGSIQLVNFRNVQGLNPQGSYWLATSESGAPVPGTPGNGNFGSLQAGALEDSTVDLTAELVNMMTAQRAYQANAQTIKTQDQVMSTLVNMR